MTPPDIVLPGCRPEPLLRYLKALGVLRLVAEQKGPEVRGAWAAGSFALWTAMRWEELVDFFLEEYQPTPVVSPWNGGSGFWGARGTAPAALQKVNDSANPRLAPYRETILRTERLLQQGGYAQRPTRRDKPRLIRRMRATLPDQAVAWLDAISALTDEDVAFAPLWGSGGNDGNLEFSNNFMQRLGDVLPLDTPDWPSPTGRSNPRDESRQWLLDSLWQEGDPPLLKQAVGQFHPGGVGGPNAIQGFEAKSLINPWDYVLTVEGSLLFAGSVSRRNGRESRAKAAFPFTVNASAGGWQTMGNQDAESARREIWAPLWEQPARCGEIAHLLAEGRAQVGDRPAANGTEFARAVSTLGVDRGLSSFVRFVFLQRSGKNQLAVPMGALPVSFRGNVRLLDEADSWLGQFRRAVATQQSGSFARALRAIDDAVFLCCREEGPNNLQAFLIALARAHRLVSLNPRARKEVLPLTLRRQLEWLKACNDGSPEYYLARALAAIGSFPDTWQGTKPVGALRPYLEPVRYERVPGSLRYQWDPDSPSAVWGPGGLARNLAAVLERRSLEARQAGIRYPAPVKSMFCARLEDIHAFLEGELDEEKLESLVEAFSLLPWPRKVDNSYTSDAGAPPGLNRLYVLGKLLFHHPAVAGDEKGSRAVRELLGQVRLEMALLTRLRAGDEQETVKLAARELRSRGLSLLGTSGARQRRESPRFTAFPATGLRVAAALLFPVSDGEMEEIMWWVLRRPEAILESLGEENPKEALT